MPCNGQGNGPVQAVESETGMQPVTYPTSDAKTVAITYAYDALKRLTSASYDNGIAFSYTYTDVMGSQGGK